MIRIEITAAAFAEAECDRIRERIGQSKADQKVRGRYPGGIVPFGFRRAADGELQAHEGDEAAIREIVALRAQGNPPGRRAPRQSPATWRRSLRSDARLRRKSTNLPASKETPSA